MPGVLGGGESDVLLSKLLNYNLNLFRNTRSELGCSRFVMSKVIGIVSNVAHPRAKIIDTFFTFSAKPAM